MSHSWRKVMVFIVASFSYFIYVRNDSWTLNMEIITVFTNWFMMKMQESHSFPGPFPFRAHPASFRPHTACSRWHSMTPPGIPRPRPRLGRDEDLTAATGHDEGRGRGQDVGLPGGGYAEEHQVRRATGRHRNAQEQLYIYNKFNIQCQALIVRIIPLYIGATFDLECDPTYVLQHRPVLTPLRNWAGTEEHLRLPQKITHEDPHLMEKYTCIVLVLIFSFTW